MNPHLTQALADDRRLELRRDAERYRAARKSGDARSAKRGRKLMLGAVGGVIAAALAAPAGAFAWSSDINASGSYVPAGSTTMYQKSAPPNSSAASDSWQSIQRRKRPGGSRRSSRAGYQERPALTTTRYGCPVPGTGTLRPCLIAPYTTYEKFD